uniref:Cytochrome P450 n=1 Tax=Arion vulgaris TaxID=1028688 RepID=A0A0B7BQ04_9EUPU
MELATLLVFAVVSFIVYLWYRRSDSRLPPSPLRALPIVGHLFYMDSDTRPQFKKWREQCGDIFSLNMCGTKVVVLSGYDLIKEALVKKADVFSDRPPFFFDQATGLGEKGVIFSNGKNWKEQRSVALYILRTFGMGKNLLALKIQEEVDNYVEYLASQKGNPTNISLQTNISTSNVICSILIGHRFEYDDQDFQNLIHKLGTLATEQQTVSLVNFMFWLKYLPGDFFRAKKLTAHFDTILNLLEKFIKETKQNMTDGNEASNFIEAYIMDREKKIKSGLPTDLDDKNLLKIVNDLFQAGTETTSTTIYWCILFILNNPGVQEKIYQEIKDNVGRERTPTMQDKNQLTYLNAVIHETQRLGSIVPLSVTHICSEDITLRGYNVPKGAYILPNLDSVLFDKTTWGEDADNFRPERFIDNNGKLNVPEQFIPFSTGRRVCLGEALAKMELFLFLSSMFQRFQFLPPTPDSIPPLDYKCGVVIVPKPYKVRVVERK